MTKSTITRERVVALIAEHSYDSALVDALEHLLAAMDSEPDCNDRNLFCSTDTARMRKVISVSAGSGATPLYRHAQPAQVAYSDFEEFWSAYIHPLAQDDELKDFAWDIWNACRAAMLAAAPQSTGSEPATVPGKWIPVSERMPEREVDVQVYCPDKKEQMVAYLESNELEGYFRFATWRTGDGIYCQPTHWMPLPAAPQEVK